MKTLSFEATHIKINKNQPNFANEINQRKSIIKNIKMKNQTQVIQAQKQLLFNQIQRTRSKTFHQASSKIPANLQIKQNVLIQDKRNKQVDDTTKMIFQKKFKNFLNHREQYERKARQRIQKIKKLRNDKQNNVDNFEQNQFVNKQELFNDQKNQNQFQNATDMIAAYQQITTGKRNKKEVTLYHAQKIQNQFRRQEFDYIILLEQNLSDRNTENELPNLFISITKQAFLNYLFDQLAVMMLYSINPYTLGDQLTEFQTKIPGQLTFQQFSKFLLIDREPTYYQYTHENIQQARSLGRGIKCQPIIAKWIGDQDLLNMLIEIFKEVDILGQLKAQKSILAKKIRKIAAQKLLLNKQVIQILNINKCLTLQKLLYQLEYSLTDSQKITFYQFECFLKDYKKLKLPQKDKLIKKLILTGKYDSSYIFILNNESLQIIKQSFNNLQKFAQYFVPKQKFIQKLIKNPKFNKIKNNQVRSQTNKYVKKETVEQTLPRFLMEAQRYVDIQEVLDFFTNRGRPVKTQHMIYMANLQMQLQRIQQEEKIKNQKRKSNGDLSTSSDDQQFQKNIKQKKLKRKKDKILAIRKGQNFKEGKKFQITVPNPFSFSNPNKTHASISQKKLNQMIAQKKRLQDQAMKPIRAKQVPAHVKQNLFEKIMKDQQRQRKQRLQRFRIQSIQNMYPISQTLYPKDKKAYKQPNIIHKMFVARPLPWYCEVNLLERIQNQKRERRERIFEQIVNKHSEYDMPQKVKQMIQRQQLAVQKKKNQRSMTNSTHDRQYTFQPKITHGMPDFKEAQQKIQMQLNSRKQAKKEIKLQPFSFQNRPTRSRTALQPKKSQNIFKHQKEQYKVSNEQINIPITKKYQALVNLRQQQSRQKSLKIEQQKKSQAIRKMRKQKFAPFVRQVLRNSQYDPSISRAIVQEKIRQFKKQEKQKKSQYQQQMLKIYTKVFNRPLLIQSSGVSLSKNQKNRSRKPQQSIDNKKERKQPNKQQLQNYGQYLQENFQPQQQYSKRHNAQNQQLRRKAIENPPRNYLMQEPNDNQQEYQYEQQGQYLSENGRYTN